MGRDKRTAKQNEYLLIGGFSIGQAGNVAPTIIRAKGNGKVLQHFPIGTRHKDVSARATELAKELGIKVGRDFTRDEWNGLEYDSPEWKAARESLKTAATK